MSSVQWTKVFYIGPVDSNTWEKYTYALDLVMVSQLTNNISKELLLVHRSLVKSMENHLNQECSVNHVQVLQQMTVRGMLARIALKHK